MPMHTSSLQNALFSTNTLAFETQLHQFHCYAMVNANMCILVKKIKIKKKLFEGYKCEWNKAENYILNPHFMRMTLKHTLTYTHNFHIVS